MDNKKKVVELKVSSQISSPSLDALLGFLLYKSKQSFVSEVQRYTGKSNVWNSLFRSSTFSAPALRGLWHSSQNFSVGFLTSSLIVLLEILNRKSQTRAKQHVMLVQLRPFVSQVVKNKLMWWPLRHSPLSILSHVFFKLHI